MYTSNPNIAHFLKDAWPILIIFTFFDTTQALGMSVIKATGKQALGAIFTALSYFLLGIPTSWYLAFREDMDNRGLWWGPAIACASNTILYNIIVFRINWKELISEVKQREEKEAIMR